MASYGKIYEFVRDSQNGAEIIITISKKNYTGESMVRPLGRAPMLKRENNGHIFGTSLEIYAECKVDGEFAQFYTSSADEFLVEVWKDQVLIWSGFISPELYSEPDIAPPYDVQIIATDGLGELRNFEFINDGDITISDHLSQLISHTGLSLETVMASDLRYYDGEVATDAVDILDFRVDLSHEDGESCYDVLQNLLSSLNASITQFNGKWFIFRETDFIGLTSADGLKAFTPGGSETFMDIAFFGSAKTCQWWPVGQLSSVIEPAKNRLTLISPNNYKNNVLDGSWTSANGAVYDEAESAYVLPDEGSYITQKLDFAGEEVGYRLALRVTARNVGSGEEDQALGVRVLIDGRSYAGERQYWLVQPASSDRGIGSYMWKTSEGSVEADLAVPSDSDTSADAQDIDIILPLYRNNNRSYIYAKTVEVTVFNPAGIHDIYVYGVSLSKYDQFEGYQANVVLDNGAREEGSSIDLSLSDGAMTPAAGNVFMSGIPLQPAADEAIISWGIGLSDAEDYIGLMAKDYSRQVALPRMSYKGVLNVPRAAIPALFLRDNTYYFPRTYTYDLYNDELEVDLISIPAADLTIDTIQVGQIAQSQGVPSSGGSGGGGGIGGGVDLSEYAKKEEVTTLSELLASMWFLDDDGNLVTEKQVIVKNNIIISGDTSTGGTGSNPEVAGTLIGIKVNGQTYKDPVNGILTIPDYPTSLEWSAINGKPTKLTEFTNDAGFITGISSSMIASALGSVNNGGKVLSSTGGGLGWISLPTSLPASDVYAWAKKSSLALADVPDLSSKYLPLSGGTIQGANTRPLVINSTSSDKAVELRLQKNGVLKADIGHDDSHGVYIYDAISTRFMGINTDGTPYYHNGSYKDTLIHSGNIGSYAPQFSTNILLSSSSNLVGYTYETGGDTKFPEAGPAMVIGSANGAYKMAFHSRRGVLLFNSMENRALTGWKTIAFTDSNVASATKLQTARTIWGQSFDGTGNVKGGLTAVQNIDFESNNLHDVGSNSRQARYIYAGWLGSQTGKTLSFGANNATHMLINTTGNVLIGTTTDSGYKLDVNGTINATTGYISKYASDAYPRFRIVQEGGVTYMQASNSGSSVSGSWYISGSDTNAAALCHIKANNIALTGAVTMSSTLRVSGQTTINNNLIVAGDTSSGSDIRFKDKITDHRIALSDIADAPLFTFRWNDREDDSVHLGSSAQYWEKVAPWLVKGEDFKTLDYSTLGVAIGISLANKAVNHEERIKILEKENKALKEQIRRIQYGQLG